MKNEDLIGRYFLCKREKSGWFVVKTRTISICGEFMYWNLISCENDNYWNPWSGNFNWFLEIFKKMGYPIVRELNKEEAMIEML